MATHSVKAAKAEQDDFDNFHMFVNVMNDLFCSHSFFSSEEDWRERPDDNEDKKWLLELEEELKDTEGTDLDGHVDNRILLYEFIKHKWLIADDYGSFGRIAMNASILIDNVCDPSLDYLDYKPEIKKALDAYYDSEESTEDGTETDA